MASYWRMFFVCKKYDGAFAINEPVQSGKHSVNRLFTHFHAQYPEHEQERIMQDLVSGQSKLRLLFVTVAFGIGVDVHDIHRIIHIGVPRTIEEYF